MDVVPLRTLFRYNEAHPNGTYNRSSNEFSDLMSLKTRQYSMIQWVIAILFTAKMYFLIK